MTFNEFKCWLDGFSESIVNAPTAEQWKKIKTKFDTVDLSLTIPNMTPSVWPVSPSTWPVIYPTNPCNPIYPANPLDKYPVICEASGSSGEPVNLKGKGALANVNSH